jgi:hypothetical protein
MPMLRYHEAERFVRKTRSRSLDRVCCPPINVPAGWLVLADWHGQVPDGGDRTRAIANANRSTTDNPDVPCALAGCLQWLPVTKR